jgi:hypothetical protein
MSVLYSPLFGDAIAKFFTDAGAPNASGTVYAFQAGTSTPALMYGDSAGGSSFVSKVLDASGSAALFGGPAVYKIDVQDANGVSLMGYPIDNIAGSVLVGAIDANSTLSPAINANGFASEIAATINKQGTGTHPVFATLAIDPPTIGAGAATLTEADTLYISAAPTGGSQDNAIHVASGQARFDGGTTTPGVSSSASSVLTVSGNVIAPTGSVHHVGAGLVKTITVPAFVTGPWLLALVPDVAFTYDATGNIVVPAGGGTAVVNKLMLLAWDGSKFTPSY